jgi:hypothetical protein
MKTQPKKKTESLRRLLAGGDRRSSAESALALAIVRDNVSRISELAVLTEDPDWLVAMRAIDLLEKLAHENAEWIEPYKHVFIGPLAESDKWEIHLQIVRALPLFKWKPKEQSRVIDILVRDVSYPQTFVKAWALDSLATMSESVPVLQPLVLQQLRLFEQSGSKALAARARNIRKRLER